MENKRLINLIKDKIISGYSDEEIHDFLTKEGLSDERIEEILHLCLQELHFEEEEIEEETTDVEDHQEHHNYRVPNYIPLPGSWWLLVQSCAILKENLVKIFALALMWFATMLGAAIGALLLSVILFFILSFIKVSAVSTITLIFVALAYFFILLFVPVCYFISVIRLISMQSEGAIDAYLYSIKRFLPIALTTALVSFSYCTAVMLFIIIFAAILFSGHPLIASLVGIAMMVPLCAILVWYSLTSVVMANDEKYYIGAVARSREYIKGHFFGFWGRSAFISSIAILMLVVFAIIIPGEGKKDKSFGETLGKRIFASESEKMILKNEVATLNLNENFNQKEIIFENFSEANFIIEGNWVCNRYDQYDCDIYRKTKSGEIIKQGESFVSDYENIKNTLAKKSKNYQESYSKISADNFICNRQNLYYCDKNGFPQIYGYPNDLSKEISRLNAVTQEVANNKLLINDILPIEDSNAKNSKMISLDSIWDIVYFIIILPIFAIYFQILYVYLSRNKEFSADFTFSKKHKILFLLLGFSPILLAGFIIGYFEKVLVIIEMFR